MTRYVAPLLICFFCTQLTFSQPKFTLEEAFLEYKFRPNTVRGIRWMNDGRFYTALESDRNTGTTEIVKYNIVNGEKVATILSSQDLKTDSEEEIKIEKYSFNSDETKILIAHQVENIYRRSTKGFFFIYDIKSKSLSPVDGSKKQSYVTLSPDGDKIAYVLENNLYIKNLNDNSVLQITTDGKFNKVINGAADWVYEEEFYISKAFKWSPDGRMIAYQKFDETNVPEYNMQLWDGLYPYDYRFKYPKAGETNSKISINIYHLESKKTVKADAGDENDIYLPRFYWVPKGQTLAMIKLNRLQNELDLMMVNVSNGESTTVYSEKSETFVDLNFTDDLKFLSDGNSFIKKSEKNGFKHIYHYKTNGDLINQLTTGDWEVLSLLGIDKQEETVYFTSNELSPLGSHVYSIKINGKSKKQLTRSEGVNSANMSPDFNYFINSNSSATSPLNVSLYNTKGKKLRVLEDNVRLKNLSAENGFSTKEFFKIPASDGSVLNGFMLKPTNFDENIKHPVLMFVYGGPGRQTVMNEWGGFNYWWHQYLTQLGYIIVSVDNRGTDGRGVDFKHSTYGQMGKLEVEDQIKVAKYLGEQKYVDKARIGIWGWSYGGYMSSLSLFLGNDIFKSAIAVAPVTNWRFYDTIYTERYLGLPKDNPDGYDAFSPINHVAGLKGNYLIIHGTGDDNVHFQNTVELVNALINNGKQFESFYYPNKDHGIFGGNTRHHLYTMMTKFILEKL